MRAGFTIIELTVVILIIAIVAAAATINLSTPLANAKFQDVQIDLESFLLQARNRAANTDTAIEVTINIDNNIVTQKVAGTELENQKRLALPADYKIKRIVGEDFDISQGKMAVTYSTKGFADSYAILIAGKSNTQHWLLVSGLTTALTSLNDEKEVKNLFKAINKSNNAG